MAPWTIALSTAIAGAARQGWRSWSGKRNALPDDERAAIFWNDQRYERLKFWMIWSPAIASLVGVAGLFIYLRLAG